MTGRCILVVEDEYFIADDLVRLLGSAGAEIVGPMSDVRDGLLAAGADARIDAAVLDINLHGEAAYPVAEALRGRDIPFVFATGYSEASIPVVYADVTRFEKPYDTFALTRALADLIERASSP